MPAGRPKKEQTKTEINRKQMYTKIWEGARKAINRELNKLYQKPKDRP